jgi:GNAT superfamily N-acetyltransferase
MDIVFTRLATEADISRLCLLYWEFHLYHVLGVPDRLRMPDASSHQANAANKLETGLRTIIQREDAAIFVAEMEGKVVGFVEVYLHQDEIQPLTVAHRYGYVQSLSVSAPYRKMGCGKALIQAAHDWAKEQGATEIQLEPWEFAEGPLLFYEKLGYHTLQRHMVAPLL